MRKTLDVLSWPFRHFPIPASLFLFTTLITGIGFLVSYRNVQASYRIVRFHQEESQQALTDKLSQEVDLQFQNYQAKVLNFTEACSTALQLIGLEGAYRYFLDRGSLAAFMSHNPEVVSIAITDGLGRQLIDNASTDLGAQDFQEYVHRGTLNAFSGASYLSPIVRIPGQKAPFVVFVEPVRDAGGTYVAAIALVISLKGLLDHILSVAPQHNTLFLCDDQGRLIAHSGSLAGQKGRAEPGVPFDFHPLVRHHLETQGRVTHVLAYEHGENAYLGSMAQCRTLPWLVCCEVPERVAFAPIYEMQRKIRVWFLIIMAGAILASAVLSVAFRLPLHQLIQGTQRIAQGDFEHGIAVNASNEFGSLANTFNQMRRAILDYLEQIKQAARKNKEIFSRALKALVNAIDAKDPYTKGHSQRVSYVARVIADQLGQDGDELERTELSALLHDVGKIGVDDRILKKAGPLTHDEFELMKRHPVTGMSILGTIDELQEITDGMQYHHENWDGKGYPTGLSGMEIPLQARIVAVADTFDAMTIDRPYQKAMTYDEAINRILELSGTRFDPAIARALADAYYNGRLHIDPSLRATEA